MGNNPKARSYGQNAFRMARNLRATVLNAENGHKLILHPILRERGVRVGVTDDDKFVIEFENRGSATMFIAIYISGKNVLDGSALPHVHKRDRRHTHGKRI